MLAPRAFLGGAAVICMQHPGLDLIGVFEMLDALIGAGRSPEAAAQQLARAIETRQIVFRDQRGCSMTDIDYSHIVNLVKAFPNGRPNSVFALRLKDDGIAALRWQFEQACGIAEPQQNPISIPNRRITTDESLVAEGVEGVRSGRWANPHQAAQELAQQADGASYESSVQRLGLKIRKAMN